jgi:hypothetical protein
VLRCNVLRCNRARTSSGSDSQALCHSCAAVQQVRRGLCFLAVSLDAGLRDAAQPQAWAGYVVRYDLISAYLSSSAKSLARPVR